MRTGGWGPCDGISALTSVDTGALALSPPSMRTQGESGLLQARERLSLDTEHAGTFSFHLGPPELCLLRLRQPKLTETEAVRL